MIRRILIFALLGCLAVPAAAVSGISLDPSLTPFTARQIGMGGLSVGFADDASGIFNNPSGLANIKFPQLVAASRKLVLDETQCNLIGGAVPTDYGTFGFGYVAMGTGGSLPTMLDPATNRIIIDPSREAMSYDNSVMAFSYAREIKIQQLPNKISLGGNLKLFSQGLSGDISSTASGMGLDLAASYRANEWLRVGASLQNLLEGNMQWEGGDSDAIGGNYKLGCRVNIMGSKEALYEHPNPLYGGIDLDIPHSTLTGTNYHLGVEYFPIKNVALRTGLNLEQNGTGISFGVGLTSGGFRFDYAFAERPGIPGDTPHYFSLSYVGERTVSVIHKLKEKRPHIKFIQPRDRSVTDKPFVAVTAEARAERILDTKTVWAVTAISETFEVKETLAYEDLTPVYLNGVITDQVGTIEYSSPLGLGRNVFEILGYTSPEGQAGSGEVKVLRIVPFSDTPMTHWAIDPIALSVTLGLVTGYPDRTFKPERGITRAELVTLLVRSLPVKLAETVPSTGFRDVPTTHWAAKYIAYGSYRKLITGYPDGTFKPNTVLTRAEGVTILVRYAQLVEKEGLPAPFPDLKADYWANKYITPAKEAGMLKYLEGKNFEPSKPFPRAEACEVLYRTPTVQRRVDHFWETGVVSAQPPETQPQPQPAEGTEVPTYEAR